MKSAFFNIRQFINHQKIDCITQIDRSMVEQYLMEQKIKKNWSPRTIKNNIQNLSTFLAYCVQQGHIIKNPIIGIPIPKQRKSLPKALKDEDAMRLLEWTYVADFYYEYNRVRARAIIAMFLFTGIRRAELLNLKVSDVRIHEKVVRIECGKGGKDRLIPMNGSLISILKQYLENQRKYKKVSPYFFTSLRNNNKLHHIVILRLFGKIKRDLQLNVYPHKLRHTFATLMLHGNCDIYALSKMMGHSDIKTTTIYLGLTTNHLNEQINKHPLGFRADLPHKKFA